MRQMLGLKGATIGQQDKPGRSSVSDSPDKGSVSPGDYRGAMGPSNDDRHRSTYEINSGGYGPSSSHSKSGLEGHVAAQSRSTFQNLMVVATGKELGLETFLPDSQQKYYQAAGAIIFVGAVVVTPGFGLAYTSLSTLATILEVYEAMGMGAAAGKALSEKVEFIKSIPDRREAAEVLYERASSALEQYMSQTEFERLPSPQPGPTPQIMK
jgi:hypothetical protein